MYPPRKGGVENLLLTKIWIRWQISQDMLFFSIPDGTIILIRFIRSTRRLESLEDILSFLKPLSILMLDLKSCGNPNTDKCSRKKSS